VRQQRSIRRKMVVGLWLVLLMLGTLAASSISGVYSYRRVVHDLDDRNREAPRSSELTAVISRLYEPLLLQAPDIDAGADEAQVKAQQAQFAEEQQRLAETLKSVREGVRKFEGRLRKMPHSANVREQESKAWGAVFTKIDDDLNSIEDVVEADDWADKRDAYIADISSLAQQAYKTAESLPDPSRELFGRLAQIQTNYRWHLAFVWVAGAATLALLLVGCGSGDAGAAAEPGALRAEVGHPPVARSAPGSAAHRRRGLRLSAGQQHRR
jgi:hypothetical protein